MVVFINPITGTETLVADERKDEYLGAGFQLAPVHSSEEPIETPVVEEKPVEKKAETVKKTTRTKKK
jgi:hypothetical protein